MTGQLTGRALGQLAAMRRGSDAAAALLSARLDGEGGAEAIESLRSHRALLASIVGADFNSTADQVFASLPSRYVIRRIVVLNASVSLTTAAGGIYAAAAKSGTVIVAAAHVYTALTAASKFLDLTLAAVCGTDWFVESELYLSLTTAQGAAATADVYIFGDAL